MLKSMSSKVLSIKEVSPEGIPPVPGALTGTVLTAPTDFVV